MPAQKRQHELTEEQVQAVLEALDTFGADPARDGHGQDTRRDPVPAG